MQTKKDFAAKLLTFINSFVIFKFFFYFKKSIFFALMQLDNQTEDICISLLTLTVTYWASQSQTTYDM